MQFRYFSLADKSCIWTNEIEETKRFILFIQLAKY